MILLRLPRSINQYRFCLKSIETASKHQRWVKAKRLCGIVRWAAFLDHLSIATSHQLTSQTEHKVLSTNKMSLELSRLPNISMINGYANLELLTQLQLSIHIGRSTLMALISNPQSRISISVS